MGVAARVRRRLHADDGVTLVELMVAMTIMLIILGGVAAGAITGLQLARGNTGRIVAANVADELISEVRTMRFVDIPQTRTVGTVERAGGEYSWVREAEMVLLDAAESACDAPPGGAGSAQPAYLRVSVAVTWAGMGSIEPVRSETLIDPPIAAYDDPYTGHLAVEVTDRDGAPVPGVAVHLTDADGPTPSVTTFKSTTSNGCAFFDNLNVIPGDNVGNYHVWLDEDGWVDRATGLGDTSERSPRPVVSVTSAGLTKREFTYDRAARLDVDLAGAHGGSSLDALPVTISNDNHNGGNGPVSFADVAALAAEPLHPFPAGFSLWAGDCDDSDPGPEHRVRLETDPGVTSVGTVVMASVDVTVLRSDGSPAVSAYVEGTDDCGTTFVATSAPTDASGRALVAMPYGRWTISVAGAEADGAWPTVDLAPDAGAATPVTVVLDD